MIQHSLIQGSPQWLAYRAEHHNASDAPAMMGVSSYKTRNQLLHEMHTGLAAEVDAQTQKRFDDGHRFEAQARSIAEEIVGEELYPVVGSLDKLSASFDGLTICDDIAWEHKTLNDSLRAAIRQQGGNANDFLAPMYKIQMEQQLLVSGAEKCLFLATVWDGETLVEQVHCWYTPDLSLRAEIVAGWEQFEKDLAAYVPPEVIEKPTAKVNASLPALVVQTRGEVTQSNLPQYEAAATAFIATINTSLATDEDFVNADVDIKFCQRAEDELEHAKAAIIGQATTIDQVVKSIGKVQEEFRQKRLALSKLVDTKKVQIKEGILASVKVAYTEHIAALEAEIKPLRLSAAMPDFAGAMKNKRTLSSLKDAVDTLLANVKISTNAMAADYRAKQQWCRDNAAGHGSLFADIMPSIIVKPMDDFQLVVKTRIADHLAAEKAKEDALRSQIEKQEREKAEAAAAAQLAADRKADADRAAVQAKADADRQAAADQAERDRAAAEQARVNAEAQAALDARLKEERDAEAERQAAIAASQPASVAVEQVPSVDVLESQADAAVVPPSLRLGHINERIAPLSINADGLRQLGFEHAATDKAAKLFNESDFPAMCVAIIAHVAAAQSKHTA